MKGILGKKIGMTQLFDETGNVVPVTVIQAGPCFVTHIKTTRRDGYDAIQLGFDEVKPKRLTRPESGHLGLLKTSEKHPERREFAHRVPALRFLREFRVSTVDEYSLGDMIRVDQFKAGDRVDIIGKSKGRGFAGVVKRHHFRGGPATHGQSDRQRAPGSVGATTTPGRTIKGMRMAGRLGNTRVTSQNLEVVRVDLEENLLAVKGSVPGPKGALIVVKEARKQ